MNETYHSSASTASASTVRSTNSGISTKLQTGQQLIRQGTGAKHLRSVSTRNSSIPPQPPTLLVPRLQFFLISESRLIHGPLSLTRSGTTYPFRTCCRPRPQEQEPSLQGTATPQDPLRLHGTIQFSQTHPVRLWTWPPSCLSQRRPRSGSSQKTLGEEAQQQQRSSCFKIVLPFL